MMTILVTMTDDNRHRHFNGVRYRLLDVNGHVLLDVDRVRPVDGDLYRHRHWFLDGVGDVFLDGVWRGYVHLHGVRHWFLNVHRHGAVYMHLDWVRHGFLYWVGHGLFDRVRNRLGDVYRVRPVDWDLNGNVHLLNYWVRCWHMYWNLDGIGNLLLNRVRSWHWDLDWVRYVFLYWVRLGYKYLDGYGPVNWDMNWVRHLLLDGVRLGYMYGYFDNLFDWVRDVFHNWVRLGYWHLDWNRDMLLNGHWDMFLYRVRNGYFLHHRDGFVHFLVTTVTASETAAIATAITSAIISAVAATESTA